MTEALNIASKALLGTLLLLGNTQSAKTNAQSIPFFDGDPNFLFLGNSYTSFNGLSTTVQKILENGIPQWKGLVSERSVTPGGKTLDGHLQDARDASGNSLQRQALVTSPEAWKWVTLQDQSQVPGFYDWDWEGTEYYNSRTAAIALNDMIAGLGGQTMFLMTWGRLEGDPANPDVYPDFLGMQEKLKEGYMKFVSAATTKNRMTYVAPAGLVFETIYKDDPDPLADGTLFRSLYQEDGSHPSVKGTYVAALTLYTSMTGLNPKEINWFPDNLDPVDGRKIQDAVSRTILRTFNSQDIVYPWSTAFQTDAAVSQVTTSPQNTLSPTSQAPMTQRPTSAQSLMTQAPVTAGPHPFPSSTPPPTAKAPVTPSPTSSGNPNDKKKGSITIEFKMDENPQDVSWALLPPNGGAPLYFQPFESEVAPTEVVKEQFDNLEPGKYLFKASDENGDGVCCEYGRGSIRIKDNVGVRTLFWNDGRAFEAYLELDIEVFSDGMAQITHKSGHYRPTTWQALEDQLAPDDDSGWPGLMPSAPLFSLAINIDIDDNPQDISWTLYRQESKRQWATYKTWNGNAAMAGVLQTTELSTMPKGWYRFVIQDSQKNGLCCDAGRGFVSITGPLAATSLGPSAMGLVWGNNGEFLDEDEIFFLMTRTGEISHISWSM
jgi:hypothetical protein